MIIFFSRLHLKHLDFSGFSFDFLFIFRLQNIFFSHDSLQIYIVVEDVSSQCSMDGLLTLLLKNYMANFFFKNLSGFRIFYKFSDIFQRVIDVNVKYQLIVLFSGIYLFSRFHSFFLDFLQISTVFTSLAFSNIF